MNGSVSRTIVIGLFAVLLTGAASTADGRADKDGESAESVAKVYRLMAPAVAGGARIYVPEPFRRDHSRPLLLLDSTTFAVPVIDESGTPGIQMLETLSESFGVWFPGAGLLAVFQGHPVYNAGCDCDIYDHVGFGLLSPYIFDDVKMQQLNDGTYEVPEGSTKLAPRIGATALPAGAAENSPGIQRGPALR